MTRSESREQAFILNFEAQFSSCEIDEIIELASEIRDFKISSFAANLIRFTAENREKINQNIAALAKRWDMKRISKVSLSVLQLAIGEIMSFDDIPVSVTINEAVELCKKYGGDDDFSFVNGILGSFVKTIDRADGKEE
ncbi:MAG: transcription antitermination factor NusB [Oscillospiraceae bacterium]|nr:transcription antitermination factor NusB [Oscillospiraceae bacterium]